MKYFKNIKGKMCYLSPMNPDDAELYTKWLNDLELTVNLHISQTLISLPKERELLEKLCKKGYVYAIVDLETDNLIGNCGLHQVDHVNETAKIGIFIGDKDYWSKGYGTEAIKLLLDYGFNILNLTNIMLDVFYYNKRAIECYKKCGFKEIGLRRKARTIAGKKYDILYMDILSEEFKGSVIKGLLPTKE